MTPKQLRKLKQQVKHHEPALDQNGLNPHAGAHNDYIRQLTHFREQFADFSEAVFLINQVLEADRLLSRGLLPQPLPELLLPETLQDTIYQTILARYPLGDPRGDTVWNALSTALPQLDEALRGFRDYLEATYGMWAYISAPFVNDLSQYLNGRPTLELMAGNGYISKGLRDKRPQQTIFTTDSKDWTKENETGKHPVTAIEPLDALAAIAKYGHQVDAIIMSWSPDGQDIDWQVLSAIRQLTPQPEFIVIGEQNGATDSKVFWTNAHLTAPTSLNKHFSHFDLIHDHVYLVK
ncbi:SAM-dependent methyltransferase [Furfurilactobacillus sp. WILCCON 0119]|uniref:SAM-dependent methyltransferase n=1 Tax=Furfurilactobacillus entadae TaxID=2922307 RepID=UPI0035E499C4